jgi:hypothetical protein
LKSKQSINLVAVVVAIIFILVLAMPWIRGASHVDRCVAAGGWWNTQTQECVQQ